MFKGSSTTVNDVRVDGKIPQGTFDVDERQLSTEIERLNLNLWNNDGFAGRSNEVQPKQETNQVPCAYQGNQGNRPGPFGGLAAQQVPTGPPPVYGGVHAEIPQQWPPTSIQGGSLSSMDLSMDRDSSMPSSFQPGALPPQFHMKQEPGIGASCQPRIGLGTGEVPFPRKMKYPYDESLAMYENCDTTMDTETEHLRWQQTQQGHSQPSSVETGSPPGSMQNPPSSIHSQPGSIHSQPGSMQNVPGSIPNQPGSIHSQPGSMQNAPGSMHSQPGSMHSQPGSIHSQPGSMQEEYVHHEIEADENGEGPLHWLSQISDQSSMAQVINTLQQCNVVSQCINVQNKHKQTPLFLAVQAGNIPLVGWLLQNGADPNIQGTLYVDRDEYMWRSPLHLAVMMGDRALSIVQLLLTSSQFTDVNIKSLGDKLTPLHMALKCHNEMHRCNQVVNELLDHKADITIREQSSSKTPFILAIQTRDIPLIQSFLEKFPADKRRSILQDQTRSGDTCLHIAAGLSRFASNQKEFLLRYLVTQGANGNVPNNVKELPRDFARTEWDRIKNLNAC